VAKRGTCQALRVRESGYNLENPPREGGKGGPTLRGDLKSCGGRREENIFRIGWRMETPARPTALRIKTEFGQGKSYAAGFRGEDAGNLWEFAGL